MLIGPICGGGRRTCIIGRVGKAVASLILGGSHALARSFLLFFWPSQTSRIYTARTARFSSPPVPKAISFLIESVTLPSYSLSRRLRDLPASTYDVCLRVWRSIYRQLGQMVVLPSPSEPSKKKNLPYIFGSSRTVRHSRMCFNLYLNNDNTARKYIYFTPGAK